MSARAPQADVAVIGGGIVGAATTRSLAQRGVHVILLERHDPMHARGGSHGATRIFRVAYAKPQYAVAARAALTLWRQLEEESGTSLLSITGGVDHGTDSVIAALRESLDSIAVEYTVMSARDAERQWPGMTFEGHVLYQQDAGVVSADAAWRALTELARNHGADVRHGTAAAQLRTSNNHVEVTTADGETLTARKVVVAAGSWLPEILPANVQIPPLRVTQEQVFHFDKTQSDGRLPVFLHHRPIQMYGLDDGTGRLKVAEAHMGDVVTDGSRTFLVNDEARKRVIDYAAKWLPVSPSVVSEVTCLYDTTPDREFIIGACDRIIVAGGTSGHGFKFAPWLGHAVAQLTLDGTSSPIGMPPVWAMRVGSQRSE